jgi:hypothetical protein
MRRFLYILGGLFLVILIAGGAAIAIAVFNGRALDLESQAYVDVSIPAIAKNWSDAELLERATPELRKSMTQEQLDSLFSSFSRIGHMTRYKGSMGGSMVSYVAGVGKTVSASYIAKATFRNGNAIFRIALVKRNGHWLINTLRVDLDSSIPVNQLRTAI